VLQLVLNKGSIVVLKLVLGLHVTVVFALLAAFFEQAIIRILKIRLKIILLNFVFMGDEILSSGIKQKRPDKSGRFCFDFIKYF